MSDNLQCKIYPNLDGLRTLACINLLFFHVWANSTIRPIENWIASNGREVFLFMMISAFSLSCGYFYRFQNNSVSINAFYKRRYRKILPLFVFLILIDVLHTFASEGFSLTEAMKGTLYQAYADITLAFGFIVDSYTDIEVVGVGWFLGVIFIFYMLYPFYTFLICTKKSAWLAFLVAIGLYFTAEFYFVPVKGTSFDKSNIIYCMPYFLAGGIIFKHREDIESWAAKKVRGCISCYGLLLAMTLGFTIAFFSMPQIRMVPFSNLLLFAFWMVYAVSESASKGERAKSFLNNRLMHFLSTVSMEIYLCHMAVFRVVEKLDMGSVITNGDCLFLVTCLMVLVGSIVFAVLWQKVEKFVFYKSFK